MAIFKLGKSGRVNIIGSVVVKKWVEAGMWRRARWSYILFFLWWRLVDFVIPLVIQLFWFRRWVGPQGLGIGCWITMNFRIGVGESNAFTRRVWSWFFHDGAIGRFQGIKRASFWPVRAGGVAKVGGGCHRSLIINKGELVNRRNFVLVWLDSLMDLVGRVKVKITV